MKGRMHHSPKGHHDTKHGGKHVDVSDGHTMRAVKAHKSGGKVGGHKGKHHAGKMARGGKMTPGSPLSGAQTKPLSFEHGTIPNEDVGGEGKDSR